VGERRDFKFGGQVDHIKSQPADDKPPRKGASRHVINFKLLVPKNVFGMAKANDFNFVHVYRSY